MKNLRYTPKTLQSDTSIWKMIVWMLLLGLLANNRVNAQVCNYKSGTVTMKLTGQTTGANITSQLVLTNANGIIQYVSPANAMTIPNVAAGNYQAVAVTYDNSVNPNLSVGGNINQVSYCNKTTPVNIGICDCNNATGIFAVTQSGQSGKPGQINKYVLTDGKGRIIAISDTPAFSGNGNGVYNVYAISYAEVINNLVVGGLISNVNGDCVDVSNGVGYVVCLPELSIVKSGPLVAEKGQNYNYTLTVTNTGTVPTNGTTIVSDTLAAGLNFISGSGSGWSCTSSVIGSGQQVVSCTTTNLINSGASVPLNLTVVSTVTGTILNHASVSGGGDVTPGISNVVITTINEPAKPNLVISKVGPASGTVGVNFDYTLTVSNTGTTGTSGVITVTDNLPANLSFVNGNGAGWTCSVIGQVVTCTNSTIIPVNGSSVITLTVKPISATPVGTPARNIAYVSGGGDPGSNPKPSNPVDTGINPGAMPNLVIVKSGPASATVGVNFDYTITVSNTGNAPTSGAITVTDNLATNLQFISGSGNGWTCAASGQLITCLSSTPLAVNSTSVITLTVKPTDASSGTTIYNKAYVSGGGDPAASPKPSPDVITVINPALKPNLIVVKSGPANGTINVNYDYTLSVSNNGNAPTNGQIIVKDNLPIGLSFISGGGSGWTCSAVGQLVTCTNSSVLAVNNTSVITITVKPTQTGIYNNIATIEGGGDNSQGTSNNVVTTVQAPANPNLVLVKTGTSVASVGSNFDYTLTVNNTGLAPTNGAITVTDNLPGYVQFVSASGAGWTCSAIGQLVTCTSSTVIASNTSSLIVITVKAITPTPIGSPARNTAYVSGGGDSAPGPKPSNEVPTDITDIPKQNVSIVKGAPNTGTVGVNYDYTLTITNGGTAPTNGIITIQDNLPTGLQFVSGSGSGFICTSVGQSVSCTNNGATQITAGQTATVKITVKPLFNGVFKNTANVTVGGITNPSNETVTNVNCTTNINPGILDF